MDELKEKFNLNFDDIIKHKPIYNLGDKISYFYNGFILEKYSDYPFWTLDSKFCKCTKEPCWKIDSKCVTCNKS